MSWTPVEICLANFSAPKPSFVAKSDLVTLHWFAVVFSNIHPGLRSHWNVDGLLAVFLDRKHTYDDLATLDNMVVRKRAPLLSTVRVWG